MIRLAYTLPRIRALARPVTIQTLPKIRRSEELAFSPRKFSYSPGRLEAPAEASATAKSSFGQSLKDTNRTSGPDAVPSRRSVRRWVYAALFLAVGFTAGKLAIAVILPPPLPSANTADDLLFRSKLSQDANNLPIVKELRARSDVWIESKAYSTKSPEDASKSLTAGAMQGSRAIGLQMVFRNPKEGRVISVVFLGGGLVGWPGIVHGGCIATMLQENMERVASNDDTDAKSSLDLELASLDLKYRKPAAANMLYVIRADLEENMDLLTSENGFINVKASLENALSGVVAAEAAGRLRRAREITAVLSQQPSRNSSSILGDAGRSLAKLFS